MTPSKRPTGPAKLQQTRTVRPNQTADSNIPSRNPPVSRFAPRPPPPPMKSDLLGPALFQDTAPVLKKNAPFHYILMTPASHSQFHGPRLACRSHQPPVYRAVRNPPGRE